MRNLSYVRRRGLLQVLKKPIDKNRKRLLRNSLGRWWIHKGVAEFSVKGINRKFVVDTWEEIDEVLNFLHGEKEILKEVLKEVKESDIVYDIGSGLGYMSCFLSSVCQKLYAFEPHPENFSVLKRNIEINDIDNISIENCALLDRESTKSMSNLSDISSRAYIVDNGEEIKTRRGDSVINSNEEPDFMYMDIGGSEYRALEGFVKSMASGTPQKMCIEVHKNPRREVGRPSIRAFGGDRDRLTGFLRNYGYELRTLDSNPYEDIIFASRG